MPLPKHKSLTSHGYVILKSELSKDEEKQLVKELTVIPNVLPAYKDFVKPKPYKIFFHSDTAYYLPRYYATEKFGPPTEITVPLGDKISAKCKFDPMPFQLTAAAKLDNMFNIKNSPEGAGGVLSLPCGYGKCHGVDTEIMMFDGSTKLVQDIVVGDQLMGDDSTPRNVLSLARGREMMYRVIPDNGTAYVVNESHILSLKHEDGTVVDICLKDYLNLMNTPLRGYRVPLVFPAKPTPSDPYETGLKIMEISDIFKKNERAVQIELLAGLIDSRATYNDGEFQLILSQKLAADTVFIARCLGLGVRVADKNTIFIYGDGVPTRLYGDKIVRKSSLTTSIRVEQLQVDNYYGFALDGNHRYLLADFQVTHNTFLALRAACKLGLKTLVVVNKECLMDQWIDAVHKFTNATVGILQRDKVEMNNDIVVAMIHSLCLKEYPEDLFEGIGFLVLDECFPYITQVITENGKMSIGKLYDMWKAGKSVPKIKSYNEKTKTFEFKKLTHAWQKTTKELVKVHMGEKTVTCTPNHKFLTTKGYISAQDLTESSVLVSHYTDKSLTEQMISKGLNDDQYQALMGSYLGDGCLQTLPSGRYRLKVIHSMAQDRYCEWKSWLFNAKTTMVEKNGYSGNPAIQFLTKVIDVDNEIPKTKTSCPQWILDTIDARGLAIWYMDDGNLSQRNTITLSTCSFDVDTHDRIVKMFGDRFGITAKVFFHKYNYITLDVENTYKFISIVYPYIHEQMMYKVATSRLLRHFRDKTQTTYDPEYVFDDCSCIPSTLLLEDRIYKVFIGAITDKSMLIKYNAGKFKSIHEKKGDRVWWTDYACWRRESYYFNIDENKMHKWSNSFLSYGTCKVTKVEKVDNLSDTETKVYDIEVADNHNFIVCGRESSENGIVVHNCHHTASETFCKALLKVRPLFTLGLSATPERRDGLSHVFYKYIGPLIHKERRQGTNQVIVKQVMLSSTSTHYQVLFMSNNTKNTSGMATALSQFPSRTKMLVYVLKLLAAQGRTTLVLSSRREHLHDIKRLLDEATVKMPDGRLATYGFYYGKQGSNKEQHKKMLEATARCDIVLGTDAIAKEGLDIPTLNTLVFATPPGVDVEQAVGRILRKYHEKIYPMVVDIVDKTGNFGSHSNERNKWYKEENYDIQSVKLQIYDDDAINKYEEPLFGFLNTKIVKNQKLLFDIDDLSDDEDKKEEAPSFDECILEKHTKSALKLKTLAQNKEAVLGKPKTNPFAKGCMLADETIIKPEPLKKKTVPVFAAKCVLPDEVSCSYVVIDKHIRIKY